MQILFIHQNFPAQFGHVEQFLAQQHGHQCLHLSLKPPGMSGPVRRLQYRTRGGATEKTHYCSRTFENAVWHAHGVYEALAGQTDVRPDLIVGHSGWGTTLFLKELYSCPMIGYFEYFYHPRNSDMDFRPDFAPEPITFLRARARNAMILLDLHYCDRGYSPTHWQRSRLPAEYRDKLDVIFDGVDTAFWRPEAAFDRRVGGWEVPRDCRLVTYAARGLEAMRGFDIFMNVASRLCALRSDVVFAIAGEDRVCYGDDLRHTGGRSLKESILSRGNFDLSRFHFLGLLPPAELAKLFSLSDLHIYLTVPFVVSWSLINALSCGCTVLASDTACVQEIIQHEHCGLLRGFFDVDGFVQLALKVLEDPAAHRSHLGQAARSLVQQHYSYEACLPRLARFFATTAGSPQLGVETVAGRGHDS
jgi:glycosyltransferase involved in cell wall biosynthesis